MPGIGPGPNSTKAMPSPRLRSLVLPKRSMVVEGPPMIQSLLASTWKEDSSSQAPGELKASKPLEDCQFQLASSVQVCRKL